VTSTKKNLTKRVGLVQRVSRHHFIEKLTCSRHAIAEKWQTCSRHAIAEKWQS
jgi:hypothetical protein